MMSRATVWNGACTSINCRRPDDKQTPCTSDISCIVSRSSWLRNKLWASSTLYGLLCTSPWCPCVHSTFLCEIRTEHGQRGFWVIAPGNTGGNGCLSRTTRYTWWQTSWWPCAVVFWYRSAHPEGRQCLHEKDWHVALLTTFLVTSFPPVICSMFVLAAGVLNMQSSV